MLGFIDVDTLLAVFEEVKFVVQRRSVVGQNPVLE